MPSNFTRDPLADLDGIKAGVEESISDIELKIGVDGSLPIWLKKMGVFDLDASARDDSVVSRLDQAISRFKRDVDGLLLEVELLAVSAHKE